MKIAQTLFLKIKEINKTGQCFPNSFQEKKVCLIIYNAGK